MGQVTDTATARLERTRSAERPRGQLPPMSAGERLRRTKTKLLEALFIIPLLVLVGVIVVVPAFTALYRSFFDWTPGYESPFAGFDNYTELFESRVVREIAGNTLVFMVGVPLWVGVPLVVALLLHERVPMPGFWRTMFFFPFLLSPVILGIIFRSLLRPDGIVNSMLKELGLGSLARNWIDDPSLVKPVIIVAMLWWTLGFGVLLYGAALSTVPDELFEAAQIDGATWLQRLRYIMIPSILPMLIVNSVFNVAAVFLMFGYVFVLTSGGPGYASTTFDYDIWQNATAFGYYGLAAAESMLLVLAMAVIMLVGGVVLKVYYTR